MARTYGCPVRTGRTWRPYVWSARTAGTYGPYVRLSKMTDGSHVRPVRTAAPSGLAVPAGRMYGTRVRAVRTANADKPTSVRAVRTANPSGLAVRTFRTAKKLYCRTGRTYGPYVRQICTGLKGQRGRSRANGRLVLRLSISETVRDTSKVTIND